MRKIGKSEFELLKNAQLDSGPLAEANRGYFSPSSLGAIVSCGEKFKRRYVLGEDSGPPNANMRQGTGATHERDTRTDTAHLPPRIALRTLRERFAAPGVHMVVDIC